MPAKKYKVTLTEEEREGLKKLVNQGKEAARKLTRARIVLLSDESESSQGWTDGQIATALKVSRSTVERTRQMCVEEGIEAALKHKRPYRSRSKVLDGQAEAHLVKLACSEAPAGRKHWTTTLKKMNLSLG